MAPLGTASQQESVMAPPRKPKLKAEDVQGLKYLKAIEPLLAPLHKDATERDRAGNRRLFFDGYVGMLLLYFFTPILTSLRGIQQASELKKVQKRLGCARASLGSLSEASGLFDPTLLVAIIAELGGHLDPVASTRDQRALANLMAVDGSLLPALPRMAWALWVDATHRAAKMHVVFEVMKGVPHAVTVTTGQASERDQLRVLLEPGRLYVIDRGYAEYKLFQEILDAGSGFVGRVRDNAVWEEIQSRPVSEKAQAAGVRSDRVVRLGGPKSGADLKQPLRLIEVVYLKRDGETETLLLATNRLDLDAEVVALAYRYRWSVELFFRWFKHILGCRHLLSENLNGLTIQVYVAIIACLLVSLWAGRKPTKRTFEMLCLYFSGWASEEELTAHIEKLKPQLV
jgi:Transposase DDE domain